MDTATLASPRLGSLLLEKGYLTPDRLASSLEMQRREGGRRLLGEVVVAQGHCTEDQVTECLAAQYGVPHAKLDARLLDPRIVDILPREYLERNLVLPLFLVRGVLTIAAAEPSNLFLIDEIRGLTKAQVQIVAASPRDIRRMVLGLPNRKVFVIDEGAASAAMEITMLEAAPADHATDESIASQPATVSLVNHILFNAVKEGAGAIHIESSERSMRVRYRVDGRLRKAMDLPRHLLDAVTCRLKMMSGMDVAERRLPQDGRVQATVEGREIDLRVGTFPTAHGEKTVVRVLDTKAAPRSLEYLGFAEDVLAALQTALQSPNGMVLVTGPSDSGKSTTLRTAMSAISTMENNVCTVEDSIDYRLPLVNQFQVRAAIGMTFPMTLRTVLRQDPDVILVSELRDEETAGTAMQAAMAGCLILAALHAGDACSAIARLIHLGVEPYLIGAALNVVLAQRLVRRICGKCRTTYEPSRAVRKTVERLGYDISEYHKGVGCPACRNTGFHGRIGIHELLIPNDELRDAIVSHPTVANLRLLATEAGMITLAHDGFRKVREGITTVEEIFHSLGSGVDCGQNTFDRR